MSVKKSIQSKNVLRIAFAAMTALPGFTISSDQDGNNFGLSATSAEAKTVAHPYDKKDGKRRPRIDCNEPKRYLNQRMDNDKTVFWASHELLRQMDPNNERNANWRNTSPSVMAKLSDQQKNNRLSVAFGDALVHLATKHGECVPWYKQAGLNIKQVSRDDRDNTQCVIQEVKEACNDIGYNYQ